MRRTILIILVAIQFIAVQAQGLRDLMPEGKFIGTAISNEYLAGNTGISGYAETFVHDFNCVVAENAYKMAYIIPDRPEDPFNLTIDDLSASQLELIDAMIDTANKYGMETRGHAFIWHSQAPSWLTTDAPGWTSQEIYDFAESYITLLGTYTKGRIDEWDVVNEALNDNGNGFRPGTWYDNVDSKQSFIEHCFTVAHAADPDASLVYNDYSIELFSFSPGSGNVKNGPMLQMVNDMIDHGAPIDGVGMQSHYISGEGINEGFYLALEKTIDSLNTLGLICNMTELDIRICGGTSEAELEKQRSEYYEITKMFLEKSNCNYMLIWGITDASSWIPGTFNGCDDALIYNSEMEPKPAYYGVRQAIMEASGIYTGPYGFDPHAIPGIIQMEDYDYNDYSDNDSGNSGGEYRADSVDITTGNTGYVVSSTEAGEYLTYTVDVSLADSFSLSFVYSSDMDAGNFSELALIIDSDTLDERAYLTGTGTFAVFDTVTLDKVFLSEGLHSLEISFISGGANIDYMDIYRFDCNNDRNGSAYIDDCETCVGGNTGLEECIIRNPFTAMSIPGIVEAENYDEGKNGVTYYDNTEGNEGGAYRSDDVDLAYGDSEEEVFVGYIESEEWLEYTVTIEETADYNVTFRVASNLNTGSFDLLINGEIVIEDVSVPNTGGWTTFSNIIRSGVSLQAGEAVVRVNVTGSYFNFDYMQFEKMVENQVNQEKVADNMQVQPNPFSNELRIEGLQPGQVWKLYSLEGRLLKEGTTNRISTGDLHQGFYLLKAGQHTFRLIKE